MPPRDLIAQFAVYLVKQNASAHTVKNYVTDVRKFEAHLIKGTRRNGDVALTKASEENIGKYVAALEKRLARTSLARNIASIKRFYLYLISRQLVENSPIASVPAPKIGRSMPRAITMDEFDQLIDVTDGNNLLSLRDRIMYQLLWQTGILSIELVQLNRSDVKWDGPFDAVVTVTKRGLDPRYFQLSKSLCFDLDRYVTVSDQSRPESSPGIAVPLFMNCWHGRLSDRSVRRNLTLCAHANDLPGDLTPHSFRHAYGIRLIEIGTPLKQVAERLGYTQVANLYVCYASAIKKGQEARTTRKSA